MNQALIVLLLIPLLGALVSLAVPGKKENLMSMLAFGTAGLQFVYHLFFLLAWAERGYPLLNVKEITLYRTFSYQFFIDLFYDPITALFLFLGSVLTFLITWYSRYYMHREAGYKRFFNTIMLFYFGFTMTVMSGNMETLFMGWEVLGVSSFLLIAFYRDRYLPVKNAMKIFTIYRIGDLGLLLAMWMTHHLFEANFTFMQLVQNKELTHHLQEHSSVGITIAVLLLITAAAKSAQLPFSSWLPRAMEGPTPSSAIFYGSLSVHMGAFLLMRTHALWEEQISVRILVVLLGLLTAWIASSIAKVQSSVKAQIAYASVSQIGLIFVEIALDFKWLPLVHICGNAFLRTYQLLVSPSVAAYLIRDQFYHFQTNRRKVKSWLPEKWRNALYLLSLKEWNLDSFMYRTWWNPLKKLGASMHFLNMKYLFVFFLPAFSLGILALISRFDLPEELTIMLPYLCGMIGLISVLKSFVERRSPELAWILVAMNHFWIALGISFNEHFTFEHVMMYLGGILPAVLIGLLLLYVLRRRTPFVSMSVFQGLAIKHPWIALSFLVCALGMTGFPVSPTFIGEDLIFSHIRVDQFFLAAIISTSYVLDGIAVIRVYARLFLGSSIIAGRQTMSRSI